MPRRASSSVPLWWFVVAVLLVGAAITGGWLLHQNVSDPYRTLETLDVPAYLENANSLRGNVYKISATIGNSLAWSPGTGRLFSVEVDGRNGVELLPLLIPVEFNEINIQKGQRYFFRVEVSDKGLLRVQDIRKV